MIPTQAPRGCLTCAQIDELQRLTATWVMPEDDRTAWSAIYRSLTKDSKRGLPFVRILKDHWLDVVQSIKRPAVKCPDLALRVLSIAVGHVEQGTGEIRFNRVDFAKAVGAHPDNISRVMTDLVRLHALRREGHGSHSVYFIDPHIGWNGTEVARQDALNNMRVAEPINST